MISFNNNFINNIDDYKKFRFITGIGSRKVPNDIYNVMKHLVLYIHTKTINSPEPIVWRSGGANGCDSAIESDAHNKEIFLPWKQFNNNPSQLTLEDISNNKIKEAQQILSDVRNVKSMNTMVKKFHTRNVFQVFGQDLETPSMCVLCWTPDGVEHHTQVTRNTGGTGTAISLASLYNIPVFNIFNMESFDRFAELIDNIS